MLKGDHHMKQNTRQSEEGNAILLVVIAILLITAFAVTTFIVSTTDVQDTKLTAKQKQALNVLDIGMEQAVAQVLAQQNMATIADPFAGITTLMGTNLFENEAVTVNSETIGEFTVAVANNAAYSDTFMMGLDVTVTAYIPSQSDPKAVQKTATAVIQSKLSPSEVFNYSYFINNWGWFYGNSIVTNGNVRSNGQFDAATYRPTINGTPRYERTDGTDLINKVDDGGIFSGWDIVAPNVRGMGGDSDNQYDFEEKIPMPNLSDMTPYETLAKDEDATIKINGMTLVAAVLGDDGGEKSHLYLVGTAVNPIELNGPVVVRGDVIIKGKVSGQGAIYATGNIFIADDIEYTNPPATPIPTSTSESDTETWLAANQSKDALGLFAREHIVIGDYNHTYWSYVTGWMSNASNKSEEDAGIDGIPNTADGRDGISGTVDDDTLEDDNEWTVEQYQEGDTIPDGYNVGDAIPGTGEDIDGDGVYDNTTNPSELYLPVALDPAYWEGLSTSYGSFSNVATSSIAKIEAALYTNHTVAALVLAWGEDFILNGTMVSRNEAFVYGADTLTINHDLRLHGGGEDFGFYLPRVWDNVEVLGWMVSE